MELTTQEKLFLLKLLTIANLPDAEGKIFAGQLQAKIEAQLSEQAVEPQQSAQKP